MHAAAATLSANDPVATNEIEVHPSYLFITICSLHLGDEKASKISSILPIMVPAMMAVSVLGA